MAEPLDPRKRRAAGRLVGSTNPDDSLLTEDFDLAQLAKDVAALQLDARARWSFGEPQNPRDPSDATLAGGAGVTDHNGTLSHMRGSWAQASIATADSPVTFTHNLDLDFINTTTPNVLWFPVRFLHNGTGVNAASTLSINYDTRDATVGRNSIQLRLYAGGGRTLAANPVEVTLFFIPSVR